MATKDGVQLTVLRKESDGSWASEGKVALTIGDNEQCVMSLGEEQVHFCLYDDVETAKITSCASAIIPIARIESTGEKIQLTQTTEVRLFGDYYVRTEVLHHPLERVPANKLKCGNCILFSHKRGVELLLQETHTFAEGEKGRMVQGIVDAMAETYKSPTLSKDNVGYCPVLRGLCAIESPACEDYK